MSDKKFTQDRINAIGRKNRRANDLSNYVFDKLQPQATDIEKAVLGGMLLDKDAVTIVIDILKPRSFYLEPHQKIFRCIQDLFNNSKPIDLLTVTDQLRKSGTLSEVGGPFFISQLTNQVGSTVNVEHHARIVAEKYILRELIRTSNEVIKDAYEDTTDVFQLLDKTEQNIFEITDQNVSRSFEKMGSLVNRAIKNIEDIGKRKKGIVGVPSGFAALDKITSGWQKTDLIIIAARPAMGKTAFTLALGRNAAVDYNMPVAVFSLEMSALQLVNRLMSGESELPAETLKKGKLAEHEWQQLNTKVENLSAAPIFIDDTPGINIFELRAKCRRLKMQYDIQMIIIDYLQLMSGSAEKKNTNREQEISAISRALKGIAKELNVPVIALSQLSRAVETRGGDKKPMLSDLRESGAIEQDADMVMFLYRPEYYGFDQDEQGNPTQGIAEVIIAKHRNGALGTIKTRFVSNFAKFVEFDGFQMVDGYIAVNDIITKDSKMNEEEKASASYQKQSPQMNKAADPPPQNYSAPKPPEPPMPDDGDAEIPF